MIGTTENSILSIIIRRHLKYLARRQARGVLGVAQTITHANGKAEVPAEFTSDLHSIGPGIRNGGRELSNEAAS